LLLVTAGAGSPLLDGTWHIQVLSRTSSMPAAKL
jgi:hypothetical protein